MNNLVSMSAEITKKELYTIIVPKEKHLGHNEASALKTLARDARTLSKKTIVLDFTHIETIDSNGFSAMLVVNRECQEADIDLIIINASPIIGKLLRISHLDEILVVKVNEWDAVNAIIAEGNH